MLERIFHLQQHGTTAKNELSAGITTFISLSYIIFVNPAILSATGMPFEAAMIGTCITVGICSIAMGITTNYPFVLAPTIWLNSMLVYSVCINMDLSWQAGMAVIFVEGVIIIFAVLTGIRETIMEAIPFSLKKAIVVGVGLLMIFMGFKNAGFIVSHPITFITLGSFDNLPTIVALIGFVITTFLVCIGIRGALLIGVVFTTIIGLCCGVAKFPSPPVALPLSVVSIFGGFVFGLKDVLNIGVWGIILAFLVFDFFDTIGNVITLGTQARVIDKNGMLPKLKRTLFVDSLGIILGSMFGAGTVTTSVESATGIIYGGRTGLTSIVCGILFLLAIFLTPIAEMIGGGCRTDDGFLHPIIAPLFIITGVMLMRAIIDIPWEEFDEAFPAFLTIFSVPFTFSIAYGIGCGIIMYTLIKIFTGKAKDLHFFMVILSILFIIVFSPLMQK